MWLVYITTREMAECSTLLTATLNQQWLVELLDKLLSCGTISMVKLIWEEG